MAEGGVLNITHGSVLVSTLADWRFVASKLVITYIYTLPLHILCALSTPETSFHTIS
jgi:hypothetical protein